MNGPATEPVLAKELVVTDDELQVTLTDGRRLSVPLAFYPTLLHATAEQRGRFEMIGPGEGFEWPGLDLHLSTEGMILGRPERVLPPELRQRWREQAEALAARRHAAGKVEAPEPPSQS